MVIGLVGVAHLFSHLYQVALAPLFPLLHEEFQVSYTALGLIITVFFGVSGACQAFVGIIVDRYGADRLLLFGITAMATAVMLMGLAPAYWVLLPLAVLSALGNCVFHPADLSILSSKVSPQRIGRAFGIHGFGGTCGYFLSPVIIYYGIATTFGWRTGLIVAGLLGLVAALVIFRFRDLLRMPRANEAGGAPMPGLAFYGRLVTNLPLMAAFLYFALAAGAGVGMQSFSAPALIEMLDSPLAVAALGLTVFLGGNAVGILVGGELADRMQRHALIATSGLTAAASCMACVGALPLSIEVAIALIGIAGFSAGASHPSRDVLVRSATPPGATGKVFGFVYSGLDLGSSLAPLLFGWLLDGGEHRGVFVAIAAMYAICILSVVQLQRGRRLVPAAAD